MEFIDYYDEEGNYLGKETRDVVHRDALWHNTVHCWLYDMKGNIYFQIRKEEGTFYTTASGHVQASESVKEGFFREIKEEIGIEVNYENAILVDVVKFVLDRENKDGSMFRDRAFSNVYICDFEEPIDAFSFDLEEIDGLVKMNAKDVLALINKQVDTINGEIIKCYDGVNKSHEETIDITRFLVNKGEDIITKYGDVLNKVIEVTS